MDFLADLHLHSRFSRATSSELDLDHLWVWAQRKGVLVIGTGDFTHPGWFAELEEKLQPAEEGLYQLRPELARRLEGEVPPACRAPVRFLLTVEISNIYKRDERTRKVHNLVCLPDLAAASTLSRRLALIGNLHSDGRPILGLDSRDLLELTLEASERGVLVPAHIWTPWFSALGSKSGFDSIEACYRDLSPHVFAVETGLSSDPAMNWRLSSLDRYALISSSDAHSPSRLGREATLFSTELSYDGLFTALRSRRGLAGTVEFFPEEGKYHFDGHRRCSARLSPAETRSCGARCPVCGGPVTVGVMSRVEELADRPEGHRPADAPSFSSLIGLGEVLGEVLGVGASSRAVERASSVALRELGPELVILRQAPVEELRRVGGEGLAEAISRMRRGEVRIDAGYDGEFGTIHLLDERERRELAGQTQLFAGARPEPPARKRRRPPAQSGAAEPGATAGTGAGDPERPHQDPRCRAQPALPLFAAEERSAWPDPLLGLTPPQRAAATHHGSPLIIVAGPGTGKTRTLTCRIACRVQQGLDPSQALAVTFTIRAAAEMRTRLHELLGVERAHRIRVCTFHALSLAILNSSRRERGLAPLTVLGEAERREVMASLMPGSSDRELDRAALELSSARSRGESPPLLAPYRELLAQRSAEDLDGLVVGAVELLREQASLLAAWRERCQLVCVDEYQDVSQPQYQLIRLLCPEGADLCVIGDPDQAIYSFRGADSSYFGRFAEDYPGAARVMLERSHRSSRVILEAAHSLIRHNRGRDEHRTVSELSGAPRVVLLRASSAAAEAEQIVESIERSVGGTGFFSVDSGRADGSSEEELSFADFAVLFRLRAQADALGEAFERSGIPYLCSAGRDPLEELAPVLDWVRSQLAAEEGTSAHPAELARAVEHAPPRLALRQLATRLCAPSAQERAAQQIDRLAALLFDAGAELSSWGPALLALASSSAETDSLLDRSEAVSLLTLHASKGLEWRVVFVAGCEEGCLPHLAGQGDLAEERRLMYVGMTRARRALILTHAGQRLGRGGLHDQQPSRFLGELPPELLEQPGPSPAVRRRRQLSLF